MPIQNTIVNLWNLTVSQWSAKILLSHTIKYKKCVYKYIKRVPSCK